MSNTQGYQALVQTCGAVGHHPRRRVRQPPSVTQRSLQHVCKAKFFQPVERAPWHRLCVPWHLYEPAVVHSLIVSLLITPFLSLPPFSTSHLHKFALFFWFGFILRYNFKTGIRSFPHFCANNSLQSRLPKMARILRYILIAYALLSIVAGQGNSHVAGQLESSSSALVALSFGDTVNPKLLPSPTKAISRAKAGLAVRGNINLNISASTTCISSNATPKPSIELLNMVGDALNSVGGAVGGVVSGVGSPVEGVATPIASGVDAAVSGAVQILSTLDSAVASTIASIPALGPEVGDTAVTARSTLKIAAVGATELVGGLLDVTLDTVSDVLTNATLSLLTVRVNLDCSNAANPQQSAPVQVADDLIEALLHPHPRDPNLRGWTYFGCFHPSLYLSAKAVLKVTNVQAGMSAKICINLCIADTMDFATVQGNQCYCSNDAPGIDSGTDKNTGTDKCNALCQGSLTEYCGGSETGSNAAMTVYKRVVSLITIPQPAYPSNWSYNGCFYMATWLTSLITLNSFSTSPSGGTDGIRCTTLCYATSVAYNIATVSGSTCYCSSLSIATSLFAGLGECSTPCLSNANETCGGTSKLGASLGISYIRRATTPSTPPPAPGTSTPSTWYNWGCYWGAAYLLDSILTGTQVSSLLDLTPDMSGTKCITICRNKGYRYSMTILGICLCNNKPPTRNLQVLNQLL
jgi:hypothetical protein